MVDSVSDTRRIYEARGGESRSEFNATHFPLGIPCIPLLLSGGMRCFYSQDLELDLPAGHPFPMEKFRVSKDMLLDGGILRPEEIIEVRAADVHLLQRVHEKDYIRKIESGQLGRKEQLLLGSTHA